MPVEEIHVLSLLSASFASLLDAPDSVSLAWLDVIDTSVDIFLVPSRASVPPTMYGRPQAGRRGDLFLLVVLLPARNDRFLSTFGTDGPLWPPYPPPWSRRVPCLPVWGVDYNNQPPAGIRLSNRLVHRPREPPGSTRCRFRYLWPRPNRWRWHPAALGLGSHRER